jgi:Helicase conserved C-terminal domain
MALPDAAWSALLRRTLSAYDEALLRQVAGRLLKPRNQWPAEELIERIITSVANPAALDRRLQELEPASRQILALIGHSRQPVWDMGNLVELAMTLGQSDGLKPVFALLEGGLLFPTLGAQPGAELADVAPSKVKTFEQWLGFPGWGGLTVFAPPVAASRAIGEDLGLPDLAIGMGNESADGAAAPGPDGSPILHTAITRSIREADGLEWLLRLSALWQQVSAAPLRRTQQGGFFKRDVERLGQDPLLNGAPADRHADVPDVGFFIEALAEQSGIVRDTDGEVRAGSLPAAWAEGLSGALEALYADLPHMRGWNPLDGWLGGQPAAGNPFASACLLALLLLARLPEGEFASPAIVADWLTEHHPYWANEATRPSRRQTWLEAYLLGIAYHLRLVQVAGNAGEPGVRLSSVGRWLLGLGDAPALDTAYTRTLLVQPNLEVVAYRQGLSASLIARLSRCAEWKSLGAACTLQLAPQTVYRALEAGETFDSIRLTLEQYSTRAVPEAVLDSLRTWSDKRERITVYPSATLLEFASAEDLDGAMARGLSSVRISDRLAVVVSEDAIDFRNFRLTGTRDYGLAPERCVVVAPDGVTLTVDLARSDLLLETELPRFAELLKPAGDGRRAYRLTPASLVAARDGGMTLPELEAWFLQRTAQPLSPAARLLLAGSQSPPPRLEQHLVLHVASEDIADGLMQWSETRPLIAERLGPTALAIAEADVPKLRERLREAGIDLAI